MQPIASYRDDPRVTDKHFILSDINSALLRKYNISSTVEDFRERVRLSKHYLKVITGNERYGWHVTRVYNITDFAGAQALPIETLGIDSNGLLLDVRVYKDNLSVTTDNNTYNIAWDKLITLLRHYYGRL